MGVEHQRCLDEVEHIPPVHVHHILGLSYDVLLAVAVGKGNQHR